MSIGKLASGASQIAFLAAAGLVAWTLIAPASWSPAEKIGELWGTIDAAATKAREQADADYLKATDEARAVVRRETEAANAALRLEAETAQRQIRSVDSTHVVARFIANAADAVCVFGVVGEAVTPGDPSARRLQGACSVGDEIREGMARDYDEAVSGKRTTVMGDIMETFRNAQGDGE